MKNTKDDFLELKEDITENEDLDEYLEKGDDEESNSDTGYFGNCQDKELKPLLQAFSKKDLSPLKDDEADRLFSIINDPKASSADKDAAKNRVICSVFKYILKLSGKYRQTKVSQADLISEGIAGALSAINKFDPCHEKGAVFSTYCYPWIKSALLDCVRKNIRIYKVPETMERRISVLSKLETDYCLKFNKEKPTYKELAKYSEIYFENEPEKIFTELEIDELKKVKESPLDIDGNINPDEEDDNSIIIYDPDSTYDPVKHTEKIMNQERIRKALCQLNEKEALILALRFGINFHNQNKKEEEMTLETIGKKLGLTRERVRQIEARALVRLKEILEKGN